MDFTELTMRILLLFFPGIVCHLIVDAYTEHKERKPYQVILHSFVFGVFSYALYFLFSIPFRTVTEPDGTIKIPPMKNNFTNLSGDAQISLSEIWWVSCVAVGLSVAVSAIHTHKWTHRLARRLGITHKFAETSVWSYIMGAKETDWVVVRDFETDFMYQGRIASFSDVEEVKELVLVEVNVYEEKTGVFLYEVDSVYLARPADKVTVEFQNIS